MAKFYTPTKLSENIRETPEGYLLCLDVPICRTGYQEYGAGETPLEVGPSGTVNVYRDEEEVTRAQTVASFQAKSVTIKHPADFVEPKNWQDLTHGVAQNVRVADEKDEDGEVQVLADLLITSELAIGLVRNGLREVSCGYEAEYEQTGEGEGRQYNIIGNHIALVEAGRAGSTYKINDHKGKADMDVFKEMRAKLLGAVKTVDEAEAASKKAKTKDEPAANNGAMKVESTNKVMDEDAYDALNQKMDAIMDAIKGMGGEKPPAEDEAEEEEAPAKKEKPAAKDDDEEEPAEDADEGDGEVLSRLKALEAAVAKMLKAQGGAEDEDGEEAESDMSGDEDEEGEEDVTDSEEGEEGEASQKKKTGDAARIEILAPGLKVGKKQDAHAEALKAAYKTKDGKKVIDTISGGKPNFKSKQLFLAASEVLKVKRGTGLEGTKSGVGFESFDSKKEDMTAEKMNELNKAHYAAGK